MFEQKFMSFSPSKSGDRKILEIEVQIVIKDSTGIVRITDVMLQGGPVSTIWTGHPSEMRWSHDY